MRRKRNLIKNNSGVDSILEVLVAVGIITTLVVGYLSTIESHFEINENTDSDLQLKSSGVLESLIGTTGLDDSQNPNWENSKTLIDVLGLRASTLLEYGIIDIDKTTGGSTIVESYPEKSIGISNTCFLSGTKIVMSDGSYKNIEDMSVGDVVKSFDESVKKIVDSKVVEVFHHSPEEMTDYYLIINDNLRVTPNHRIYSDGKWIFACDLKSGNSLFYNNDNYKIYSIEKRFEKTFTYNFEVEGNHNYFVALFSDDLLVHNYVREPQYENPVADAGGPYDYNSYCTLQLDGSGSYGGYGEDLDYLWDLDDDGLYDDSTVCNPLVNFTDGSDHIIKLKVTDDLGNLDIDITTASETTFVMGNPIANPGSNREGGGYQGVKGYPITFDASPRSRDTDQCSCYIQTYLWDWDYTDETFDDTINYPNAPIIDRIYSASGTYTARLKVIDNEGTPVTVSFNVYISETPPDIQANFEWFDIDGLGAGKILFFNAESSVNALKYKWDYLSGGVWISMHKTEEYIFDPLFIPDADFLLDNPTEVKLTVYDNLNFQDQVIKTVETNAIEQTQPTETPWILSGKIIYPLEDNIGFYSFGEGYFVEIKEINSITKDISRYLYKVISKDSSDYLILDYEKIIHIKDYSYSDLKEKLGIVSDKIMYNFNVKIIINDVLIQDYGASYENAIAVQSVTKKILVRYPPLSKDHLTLTDHPFFEPGEIMVYLFIGGTEP